MDYRSIYPPSFDPMEYCRTLDLAVRNGELTWDEAQARWRNYQASVDALYPSLGPLPGCSIGAPADSPSRYVPFLTFETAEDPAPEGPAGGFGSLVLPGLRDPVGPSGSFSPWGDFRPQDLETCYPRSVWIRQRLAAPWPPSRGNAITDPFPVPFTTQEVKDALRDVYRHRKDHTDRHCARIDADSVQIALAVLPILESRNGGWLDFDPDRRESSSRNTPSTPRRDVFNLRCLLSRLPGKLLPPIYAGPCHAPQPRRLEALLNIEDVATTYQPGAAAPPAGGLFSFGAPESDAPGGGNAYFPALSPVGGRPFFPADGDRLGFHLNGDVPAPEAPSHTLFEILETHDIKGD